MIRFNEAIDLIRRRTNNSMGSDGIAEVYIKFEEEREKAHLIFITKDDLDSTTLTKLAVRYNHLFEDHLDIYTIKILTATNYFKKDRDTFLIWRYSEGF